MQTRRNELNVTRGETFTLDRLLVNKDGSPYIVSKNLENPHWLISVSNTRYAQEDRYVKNYWLPVSNVRFYNTVPVYIKDIKNSADENAISKYNTFDDISEFPLTGYYKNKLVSFDDGTDSLFYDIDIEGNKVYKYWNDESKEWQIYNCNIIKTFLQTDTKEWVSQNYQYSIQLVSGTSMLDYLFNLAFDNNLTIPSEYNIVILLDLLTSNGVTFPANFDATQPIVVSNLYPILEPTKMRVINDTKGEILW